MGKLLIYGEKPEGFSPIYGKVKRGSPDE